MKSYEEIYDLSQEHPIMFFDGECIFCCRALQFFIKIDKNQILRYATLQSDFGKKLMQDLNLELGMNESVILLYKQKPYLKTDVTFKVLSLLRYPYKALSVFKIIPRFVRNWIYDIIAKNRIKWFGQTEQCYIPTEANKHLFIKT